MEPVEEPTFFSKRNIFSILALLVISVGIAAGFYVLRNQTTQLQSQAADTGTCSGDNSFCMWADSAPTTGQNIKAGSEAYVYVVGKSADTNVRLQGTANSSSAEVFTGAQCGAGDYAHCWRFRLTGITQQTYSETFVSDQAPTGRVADSFAVEAGTTAACPTIPTNPTVNGVANPDGSILSVPNTSSVTLAWQGNAPSYTLRVLQIDANGGTIKSVDRTENLAATSKSVAVEAGATYRWYPETTATSSCPVQGMQGRRFTVAAGQGGDPGSGQESGTLTGPNTVNGDGSTWEQITLNASVRNTSGGKVFYSNVSCNSPETCIAQGGWTLLPNGFVNDNTSKAVTWTPNPGQVPAGAHTFTLWNNTENIILAVKQVTYQVQTPPTKNASSCEYIRIIQGDKVYDTRNGNDNLTMVVGQTYNVEIGMKNVDSNKKDYTPVEWVADKNIGVSGKYYLGFPTSGPPADNGAGDFRVNRNDSVKQWNISWADKTKLRIALDGNIVANQAEVFKFTASPTESGSQSFYWGMVQEGVEWFGAQCAIDIDVDPAGGLPASGTQCAVVAASTNADPIIPDTVKCDMSLPTPAVEGGMRVYQYTTHPLTNIEFGFGATAPAGEKVIHVRFISTTGQLSEEFTKKILYSAPAAISTASCTYLSDGTGTLVTLVTIEGIGFGATQGQSKITAGGKTLEDAPVSWADNKVQIRSKDRLTGSVPIKITTADNKSSEKNCSVNVSSVDFKVRVQCRTPDKAAGDELDIKIHEVGAATDEPQQRAKPKLDAQGKSQNFTVNLEDSKSYVMVIKGPGTLAKKVQLPAGTRIIDAPIVLPVGDIGGNNNDIQDGTVSTLDRALLFNQYSAGADVTNRPADLNKDKRVNSIDYACMSANNGIADEKFDRTKDTGGSSSGGNSSTSKNTTVSVSVNDSTPNVGERITITGILRDAQNNPVTSKVVKLIDSNTGLVLKSSDQTLDNVTHNTNASGVYTLGYVINANTRFSAYVKFEGDSSFNTSQSAVVTITPAGQ